MPALVFFMTLAVLFVAGAARAEDGVHDDRSARAQEHGDADTDGDAFFRKGYLSIGAYWSPFGKGRYSFEHDLGDATEFGDADADLQLAAGLRLAAYYALRKGIHIGAFFDVLHASYFLPGVDGTAEFGDDAAERQRQFNFGVSTKLGRHYGPLFASVVVDLGFLTVLPHFVSNLEDIEAPAQRGVSLYPHAQVDLLIVEQAQATAALFLGFGPTFQLVSGDMTPNGHLERKLWSMGVAFTMGGSFGR